MSISVIVLAAGASSRYGANKLIQFLGEKTILEHTLDQLRKSGLGEIIVVTCETTWEKIQNKHGLVKVIHSSPEKGMSYSIRCGLEVANKDRAYMFIVGDQPLISEKIIKDVAKLYEAYPNTIVGAGIEGELRNPVIFPGKYREKLMDLSGDLGGKALIKKEQLSYRVYNCLDKDALWDIDTKKDYEEIRRRTYGVTKK